MSWFTYRDERDDEYWERQQQKERETIWDDGVAVEWKRCADILRQLMREFHADDGVSQSAYFRLGLALKAIERGT